ncbi:MAG: hypothetical protein IJU16_05905, partial [Clostridia bacterium]|nr:hypothetical protein [Clostridia bacterium]
RRASEAKEKSDAAARKEQDYQLTLKAFMVDGDAAEKWAQDAVNAEKSWTLPALLLKVAEKGVTQKALGADDWNAFMNYSVEGLSGVNVGYSQSKDAPYLQADVISQAYWNATDEEKFVLRRLLYAAQQDLEQAETLGQAGDLPNATKARKRYTQSIKDAADFLRSIQISKRDYERQSKLAEANFGNNAMSAIVKAVISPIAFHENVTTQTITGGAEPYSDTNNAVRWANDVQANTAQSIDNPFGKFAYQGGMSMANWLLTTAMTGGFGGGELGSIAASIVMGMQVAEDTWLDSMDRGADPGQAMVNSLIAGALEALFEKVSLGNLKSLHAKGIKDALKEAFASGEKFGMLQKLGVFAKNVGKQMLVEGSEEIFTEIGQILADKAVMGKLSNGDIRIRQLMEQGYSYEEAKNQTILELAQQIGEAGLQGALQGGIIGSLAMEVNYRFGKFADKVSSGEYIPYTDQDGNLLLDDKGNPISNRQAYKMLKSGDGTFNGELASAVGGVQADVENQNVAANGGQIHATTPTISANVANESAEVNLQNVNVQQQAKPLPTAETVKAYSNQDSNTYSRALSHQVLFYDGDAQAESGFFSRSNNTIYINMNSEAVKNNQIGVVLAHEYMHTLEGTEEHERLRSYVFGSQSYQDVLRDLGVTHEEYVQQRQAQYEEQGASLDSRLDPHTAAENEVVAQFLGEHVLNDLNTLTELARTDKNVFQKLWGRVKRWIARVKAKSGVRFDEYSKMERLFEQAAEAASKNAPTETGGTQYSMAKSFDEQVDDLLNGKDQDTSLELYVCDTPELYTRLGLHDAPVVMRKGKVREILSVHSEMTPELIKSIPYAIENPILVLVSKTRPNDSIVCISEIVTSSGSMIVPIRMNTQGRYYDLDLGEVTGRVNRVSSAYGKNVHGLLEYAKENNGILYLGEKNRAKSLFGSYGVQFPTPLLGVSSNSIIRTFQQNVNTETQENNTETQENISNKNGTLYSLPQIGTDSNGVVSQYTEKTLADPTFSDEVHEELEAEKPRYGVHTEDFINAEAKKLLADDAAMNELRRRILSGGAATDIEARALQAAERINMNDPKACVAAINISTQAARTSGQALGAYRHETPNYAGMAPAERMQALLADRLAEVVTNARDLANKFIDRKWHQGAGKMIEAAEVRFAGMMDEIGDVRKIGYKKFAETVTAMLREVDESLGDQSDTVLHRLQRKLRSEKTQKALFERVKAEQNGSGLARQGGMMDAFRTTVNEVLGIKSFTSAEITRLNGIAKRIATMQNSQFEAASETAKAQLQTQIYGELDSLTKYIADHLTINGFEAYMSYRKFCMLSNARTHLRNVLSNATMMGVNRVDDAVQQALELFMRNKLEKRTRSVAWRHTKHGKAIAATVKQTAEAVYNGMNSILGYAQDGVNPSTGEAYKVQINAAVAGAARSMFGEGKHVLSRFMNLISGKNSYWLEAEDGFFFKRAFVQELGQLMTVEKATTPTDAMIEKATERALYCVFRADNMLNDAMNSIKFNGKTGKTIGRNTALKIANSGMDIILPFTKTPSNLINVSLDHSAVIGTAKTVAKIVQNWKNNATHPALNDEVIRSFSRAITGMAFELVGALLAALGILKIKLPDDDRYNKVTGNKSMAVEICGVDVAVDWLQPTVTPFLVGAAIQNSFKDGFDVGSLTAEVGQVLFDQSYLQSVQQVFDTGLYEKEDFVTAVAENVVKSIVGQNIPTAVGQLARAVDPIQRRVNDQDPWVTIRNTAMSRIPGLSYALEPQMGVWGDDARRGNYSADAIGVAANAANQFLVPANISLEAYPNDDATQELIALYDRIAKTGTSAKAVFPSAGNMKEWETKSGTLLYDDREAYHQAESYVRQACHAGVEELIKTAAWKKKDDEDKKKALSELYADIRASAKDAIEEYDLDTAMDFLRRMAKSQ